MKQWVKPVLVAATAALNWVLFSVTVLVSGTFLFALLVSVGIRQNETMRLVAQVLGFALAGVVIALWTRQLMTVVVPAALGFLTGRGAMNWAIYLTDSRGEGAPPMWRLVVRPSLADVVFAVLAAAAAGIVWWLTSRFPGRLRRHPQPAVDQHV